MLKRRIESIDLIRGLAILIMIAANAYPYLYPFSYCPILLRILFSTAAPIFIFLSGMSLRLAQENGSDRITTIIRACQVLIIAVIIDTAVWGLAPFYTMDVLYLLSISLLLLILISGLPDIVLLICALFFFIPLFFVGRYYQFDLIEVSVIDLPTDYSLSNAARHFLVDGWFPIFPWTAFSILGYLICKRRDKLVRHSTLFLATGISAILLFSLAGFGSLIEFNPIRDGYTEIFYPVTLPFCFYIAGIYMLIMCFIKIKIAHSGLLRKVGRYSLPVYLIHSVLIKFYLPIFSQEESSFSLAVFAIGLMSLYVLVYAFVHIADLNVTALKSGNFRPIGFIIGL